MNRIYHPWHLWEDYQHNFYGGVSDDYIVDDSLQTYASLLKDLKLFEHILQIIIAEWKYSCEHNLTNESLNRIAYLGQAAMAYQYKVPSHKSMGGYNLLSETEKQAADEMAKKYLDLWLSRSGAT